MWHSAFPLCICGLTLACISSETSTKLLGMPTYPDRSSSLLWTLSHPNSSLCCPVSTGHSRHPSQLFSPFVQLFSRSLTHFRSRRDRRLRHLFGFAPKQTKGPSASRTTYIVLHYILQHQYRPSFKSNSIKIKWIIFRNLSLAKEGLYFHFNFWLTNFLSKKPY